MAWSPDGSILAVGQTFDDVILWDIQQEIPLKTLHDEGQIHDLSWSVDNKIFAVAIDNRAIVWNIASGEQVSVLEIGGYYQSDIALSPNGSFLASVIGESIIIWDVKTGKQQHLFDLSTEYLSTISIAWSPDSTLLAASQNDTLHIWHAQSGKEIHTLPGGDLVLWHPNGKAIASGTGSTITLWDSESGAKLQTYYGYQGKLLDAAWFGDQQFIVYATENDDFPMLDSERGRTYLWASYNAQSVHTLEKHGENNRFPIAAWSPKGQLLAADGGDGRIILWDMQYLARLLLVDVHDRAITDVAWNPAGTILASGSYDSHIVLWDAVNNVSQHRLTGHGVPISEIAWSPDGKRLASVAGDHRTIIWDAQSGEQIRSWEGQNGGGNNVVWAASGNSLLTTKEKQILVWDPQSEAQPQVIEVGEYIEDMALSPDGRLLAVTIQAKVILWDAQNWQRLYDFDKTGFTPVITWHPNSITLAVGDGHRQITFWDVNQQEVTHVINGDTNVTSLAWHPQGRFLAIGNNEGEINLWDIEEEASLYSWQEYTAKVSTLAWHPTGSSLTSGSDTRGIHIRPAIYLGHACTWLLHNMSLREWKYYFPWSVYHATCPELPSPTRQSIWAMQITDFVEYFSLTYTGWLVALIITPLSLLLITFVANLLWRLHCYLNEQFTIVIRL